MAGGRDAGARAGGGAGELCTRAAHRKGTAREQWHHGTGTAGEQWHTERALLESSGTPGRPHVVRVRNDGENGKPGEWVADVACPRAFVLSPVCLPENGVHFSDLGDVARRFGELRCTSHVVVLTYSPYMLDQVILDRDQVLIFRKQDDGSRTVTPINVGRVRQFMGDDGF